MKPHLRNKETKHKVILYTHSFELVLYDLTTCTAAVRKYDNIFLNLQRTGKHRQMHLTAGGQQKSDCRKLWQ